MDGGYDPDLGCDDLVYACNLFRAYGYSFKAQNVNPNRSKNKPFTLIIKSFLFSLETNSLVALEKAVEYFKLNSNVSHFYIRINYSDTATDKLSKVYGVIWYVKLRKRLPEDSEKSKNLLGCCGRYTSPVCFLPAKFLFF